MRKTLLIAAAALAGSIISSQAQVYSQNIVGYVNVPSPVGYIAAANPLDTGNGNSATNFLDTVSGNQDGNSVLTWTGHKFTGVNVDSTSATGFSDPSTFLPVPAPILPPGQGFLLQNNNSSNTVTFVGTVSVGGPGASTNVVGIATNNVSSATTYVFISSVLPIGGGISSVLQFPNPSGNNDGCTVLTPNIVAGNVHGYVSVNFDSTSPTGFSDPSTFQQKPEPQIAVGQGFLFSNVSGGTIPWVQSL